MSLVVGLRLGMDFSLHYPTFDSRCYHDDPPAGGKGVDNLCSRVISYRPILLIRSNCPGLPTTATSGHHCWLATKSATSATIVFSDYSIGPERGWQLRHLGVVQRSISASVTLSGTRAD